jgi:excisionase family DNA binding protein
MEPETAPEHAPTQETGAAALAVRVRDACRVTGIGRSKLYELIKDGHLRTIKVGAITLIPMAELRKFLGLERE